MMRFAEISKGFVSIITVSETEEFGEDWLNEFVEGQWIYIPEGSIAELGYTYNEKKSAFIPPQPFNSWILNDGSLLWEAPIPKPEDGKTYFWDEESTSWTLLD
jgi:hypothetical protein